MVSVTYEADPEQIRTVNSLICKRNHKKHKALIRSRWRLWLSARLHEAFLQLFVLVPFLALAFTQATVGAWGILYFVVASCLSGVVLSHHPGYPREREVLYSAIGAKGLWKVSIDSAGLKQEFAGSILSTPWTRFTKVYVDKNFLILEEHNGAAKFIPTSAFPSKEALDTFTDEIRIKIFQPSDDSQTS